MTASVPDPATGLPIGQIVDGEPARRPSRDLRLEGRHVSLVPLDPAGHADDLYRALAGADLARLYRYLFAEPPTDAAAFRRASEAAAAGDDPFALAILDRGTGLAVGQASYMRIEPAHRAIEVGHILFAPALQRSPGGTESMFLMARHAFETLGYRRYEWKCDALNAPSRRAAARYGFVHEGVFRDHMIVKGRSRDTAWFAMTGADWPARRLAFERWLDPANFYPDGRQMRSLSSLNLDTAS